MPGGVSLLPYFNSGINVDPLVIGLKTAGIPFAVSAIISILFAWRIKEAASHPNARRIGALAIFVGFAAGYFAFFGFEFPKQFNLVEAWHWMLLLAIVFLVAILIRPRDESRFSIAAIIATVGFLSFLYVALRPLAKRWETTELVMWMGGLTVVGALWFAVQSSAVPKSNRRLWPLMICLICICSFAVFMLQFNSKLGFLITSLSAALGPIAIFALMGRIEMADGASRFAAWMLPPFLICHYFYSIDVPAYTGPLVLAAGFAPLVGLIPAIRKRPIWQMSAIQMAVVLIFLAGAIIPAAMNYEPDPYGY